jgi:hypothetical protein
MGRAAGFRGLSSGLRDCRRTLHPQGKAFPSCQLSGSCLRMEAACTAPRTAQPFAPRRRPLETGGFGQALAGTTTRLILASGMARRQTESCSVDGQYGGEFRSAPASRRPSSYCQIIYCCLYQDSGLSISANIRSRGIYYQSSSGLAGASPR